MECPHCGLFNPDSSDACDCGYSFRQLNPTQTVSSNNQPLKSTPHFFVLVVVFVVAFVATLKPIGNALTALFQELFMRDAVEAVNRGYRTPEESTAAWIKFRAAESGLVPVPMWFHLVDVGCTALIAAAVTFVAYYAMSNWAGSRRRA